MKCHQVQEALAGYSAGFVQGEERQRLQAHLAQCPACRERLEQFRALDGLLVADRPRAGEDFVRGVMSRVRAEVLPRGLWWRMMLEGVGPLVAAAAVLPLVCMVAYQVLAQHLQAVGSWDAGLLLAQPVTGAAMLLGMVAVTGLAALVAARVGRVWG